MDKLLKDRSGKELPFNEVFDRAFVNIRLSMNRTDLIREYMAHMVDDDLILWATDEEGNFVDEEKAP